MSVRERVRLGGRSARIQAAVHQAVEDLSTEIDRTELTVPLVATRAGVPPSTIYRRWGGLPELLADVAVQRLRPLADPLDTGTLRGDLENWTEQYMEEMSSPVGLAMMRDVLSTSPGADNACQCSRYIAEQLEVIAARARKRGEATPSVDAMIDGIVAPIMYRILFGAPDALDAAYCDRLIDGVLGR